MQLERLGEPLTALAFKFFSLLSSISFFRMTFYLHLQDIIKT